MIDGIIVDPKNLQQINNLNNVYINWIFEQLVTAPQMNLCTQDIYNKIGALTENTLPCIITGATVSIVGSNINISSGFFRCEDINDIFLGAINVQGFFNTSAITLPITSNYYIVTEINISPTSPGQYTYALTGIYSLIPDLTPTNYNAQTMVIIGQINSTGDGIEFGQRDFDYGNLISNLIQNSGTVIDTDYQILPTDNMIVSSTADITLTLPLITSVIQPRAIIIFNSSNGNIIIDGNGSNIANTATYTLSPYSQISLIPRVSLSVWIVSAGGILYPDITDISGLVSIRGTNGLAIKNNTTPNNFFNLLIDNNGNLAITKNGTGGAMYTGMDIVFATQNLQIINAADNQGLTIITDGTGAVNISKIDGVTNPDIIFGTATQLQTNIRALVYGDISINNTNPISQALIGDLPITTLYTTVGIDASYTYTAPVGYNINSFSAILQANNVPPVKGQNYTISIWQNSITELVIFTTNSTDGSAAIANFFLTVSLISI